MIMESPQADAQSQKTVQDGSVLEAGKKLREAMEMQEGRLLGTFHIPPQTATKIWEDAKIAWDAAVATTTPRGVSAPKWSPSEKPT